MHILNDNCISCQHMNYNYECSFFEYIWNWNCESSDTCKQNKKQKIKRMIEWFFEWYSTNKNYQKYFQCVNTNQQQFEINLKNKYTQWTSNDCFIEIIIFHVIIFDNDSNSESPSGKRNSIDSNINDNNINTLNIRMKHQLTARITTPTSGETFDRMRNKY